jgi:hypothetical protein
MIKSLGIVTRSLRLVLVPHSCESLVPGYEFLLKIDGLAKSADLEGGKKAALTRRKMPEL